MRELIKRRCRITTNREMKETEARPSLRISHIVHGRQLVKNRVYYLVDPRGQGDLRAVPETVVLRRWRGRRFPAHTFSGVRLSSTLWRAVGLALGRNARALCRMSAQSLAVAIDQQRALLKGHYYALPAPAALHALFAVCGPDRLSAVLHRHLAPDRGNLSGVPDLFLYATHNETGLPSIARFVEVKKPEEQVSRVQIEEIAFLNALGLHARVLRLIEPKMPTSQRQRGHKHKP